MTYVWSLQPQKLGAQPSLISLPRSTQPYAGSRLMLAPFHGERYNSRGGGSLGHRCASMIRQHGRVQQASEPPGQAGADPPQREGGLRRNLGPRGQLWKHLLAIVKSPTLPHETNNTPKSGLWVIPRGMLLMDAVVPPTSVSDQVNEKLFWAILTGIKWGIAARKGETTEISISQPSKRLLHLVLSRVNSLNPNSIFTY